MFMICPAWLRPLAWARNIFFSKNKGWGFSGRQVIYGKAPFFLRRCQIRPSN